MHVMSHPSESSPLWEANVHRLVLAVTRLPVAAGWKLLLQVFAQGIEIAHQASGAVERNSGTADRWGSRERRGDGERENAGGYIAIFTLMYTSPECAVGKYYELIFCWKTIQNCTLRSLRYPAALQLTSAFPYYLSYKIVQKNTIS